MLGPLTRQKPHKFMKIKQHNETKMKTVDTVLADGPLRDAAKAVKDDFATIGFDAFQTIFVCAAKADNVTHMSVLLNVMDLLGFEKDAIYTMAGLSTAIDETKQHIAQQMNDVIFSYALQEELGRN